MLRILGLVFVYFAKVQDVREVAETGTFTWQMTSVIPYINTAWSTVNSRSVLHAT
jgi:hypothetical protein